MEDSNPDLQGAKEARVNAAMAAAQQAIVNAGPQLAGTVPVAAPEPAPAPVVPPSGFTMPQLIIIGLLAMLLLRGGQTPSPTPDPLPKPPIPGPVDPKPPTPPSPVVKKLPKGAWLVVIESTEDRDKFPHMAMLQKDVKFWDSVQARGYKQAWLDSNEDQAKAYERTWGPIGLPCLLGVMPDATIPLAIPCPPSSDTLEQYLEP